MNKTSLGVACIEAFYEYIKIEDKQSDLEFIDYMFFFFIFQSHL